MREQVDQHNVVGLEEEPDDDKVSNVLMLHDRFEEWHDCCEDEVRNGQNEHVSHPQSRPVFERIQAAHEHHLTKTHFLIVQGIESEGLSRNALTKNVEEDEVAREKD